MSAESSFTVANAKLFGLLPDLNMTNGMYNVALMVSRQPRS